MGRARELSMGPKRPRTGSTTDPDFATLKRLTQAQRPDLDTFRAVLDRVGARAERPLFGQGVIYIEACQRYTALTGEQYGPVLGTY